MEACGAVVLWSCGAVEPCGAVEVCGAVELCGAVVPVLWSVVSVVE